MTETVVGVRDDEGHGYDLVQYEDTYLPVFFKMLLKGLTVGEKLKQVKSMAYQDGDVLICSYPKTGRTYTCWHNVFFIEVWSMISFNSREVWIFFFCFVYLKVSSFAQEVCVGGFILLFKCYISPVFFT